MAALGAVKLAIGADVSSAMKSLGSLSMGLAKVGTAAAAVTAALAGLAVKGAGDFEATLTSAAAKTDDFTGSLEAFEKAAISAGAKSAFSANEAAGALEELAMSGYSATEATSALEAVLNGAAASGMDLSQTTEILTGITQGFGKEATEMAAVTDIMASTATSSSQTMEQLGQSMSYAAPVANGLGIRLSETAAVMGLLADANIKGSRAGTGFNNILSKMVDASDSLGGSLTAADVESKGFAGSLEYLQERGLTAQNAIDLFGREAGPALQALLGRGAGAIREFDEELQEAGGTAQDIADKQLNTFNGQMQILTGTIETLGIAFGQTLMPVMKEVMTVFQEIFGGLISTEESFEDLAESSDGFVDMITKASSGGTKFEQVLDKIKTAMRIVADTVRPVVGVIKILADAFVDVGKAILGSMSTGTSSVREFVDKGLLLGIRGVISMTEAINNWAKRMAAGATFIGTVVKRLTLFAKSLGVGVGAVLLLGKVVRAFISEGLSVLLKGLAALIDTMAQLANHPFADAFPGIETIRDGLAGAVDNTQALSDMFGESSDQLLAGAEEDMYSLNGRINDLKDTLDEDMGAKVEELMDRIAEGTAGAREELVELLRVAEEGIHHSTVEVEESSSGADSGDGGNSDTTSGGSGSGSGAAEENEFLKERLNILNAVTDVEKAQAELALARAQADEKNLTGLARELALGQEKLNLARAEASAADRSDQRDADIAHAEAMRTFLLEKNTALAEEMAHEMALQAMRLRKQEMEAEGLSNSEIELEMIRMRAGLEGEINRLLEERSETQDEGKATIEEKNAALSSMTTSIGSAISAMGQANGASKKWAKGVQGVGAMIQKALAFQLALNAASAANPFGAIAAGVGLLATGISTIAGMKDDEDSSVANSKEQENDRLAKNIAKSIADEQEKRFGQPINISVDARGALVGEENEVARSITDLVEGELNNRVGGLGGGRG